MNSLAFGLMAVLSSVTLQQDRVAQLDRVTEGLNDPNPAVRIATLEEAVNSGDRALRQHALSQALASDDRNLRSSAVFAAFQTSSEVIIDFELQAMSRAAEDEVQDFFLTTGGTLDVRLAEFEPTSGNFLSYSSLSHNRNDEITVHQGNISGDRASLVVDVSEALNGGTSTCRITARGRAGDAQLFGSMGCDFRGAPAQYSITIDLLG